MQTIDPLIFKAYDIRGIYPEQINEDIVYRIARSFAQKLKPRVTVVGRDMRVSGLSLLDAVCRGVMDEGSDVIDIGMTTTPMYYYAVNTHNADAGIAVTASHNPEQYNGLKLTGRGAVPSVEFVSNDELQMATDHGDFSKLAHVGKLEKASEPINSYVRAVRDTSGLNDLGGIKLVIDTGNGMEGIALPLLFQNTNCEVTPLFWKPDGHFPNHEANPLKDETLIDLKRKVAEIGLTSEQPMTEMVTAWASSMRKESTYPVTS